MAASQPRAAGRFAVLTPPGPAAIAVVRIFGGGTRDFLTAHLQLFGKGSISELAAGAVRRAVLRDAGGAPLDDILISVHEGQAEDVRLHLHGSDWVVATLEEMLRLAGFAPDAAASTWPDADELERERLALLPRLLTWGGVEWLSAVTMELRNACGEMLRAPDARAAAGLAAGVRTDGAEVLAWFSAPLRIALVGPPNAGKSTLLNALADQAASIVSSIPGTTRDWVEAQGEFDGLPCSWIDTAGLRETADGLEAAGIERALRIAEGAEAVVLVLDGCAPAAAESRRFLNRFGGLRPSLILWNKCDRPDFEPPAEAIASPRRQASVSASESIGVVESMRWLVERHRPANRRASTATAFTERQVRYLWRLREGGAATDHRAVVGALMRGAGEIGPAGA